MKAEQRKELETNTLADKMGHMMQRVKTGQRRTLVLYFVAAAVVLVTIWYFYRSWEESTLKTSMQWLALYDGSQVNIRELSKETDKPANKAARLQAAWITFWELGVQSIAADKMGALANLKAAEDHYGKLVEECKDDKVFEPQAMLGQAVCNETLAVQDTKKLKKATELYDELVKKYPKSAEAKFAKDRLDILQDKKGNAELAATYEDLRRLFLIDLPFAPPMFQPNDPFHKNFPDFK